MNAQVKNNKGVKKKNQELNIIGAPVRGFRRDGLYKTITQTPSNAKGVSSL